MPDLEMVSPEMLFQKARAHFTAKKPFVLYKKPDSEQLVGIFQQTDDLYWTSGFTEKGYVFAPFHGKRAILIPESESLVLISEMPPAEKLPVENAPHDGSKTAKSAHLNLVRKAIETIQTGAFEKLVVSRKEDFEVPGFDFILSFQKLLSAYPTAFSYCFFHPESQMWLGAFSELLLKVHGNELFTMSVAGTQKWKPESEITWQPKETMEQELVTGYLAENLKKVSDNIQMSKPYTLKAGALAHLKTDLKATLRPDSALEQIIPLLHPTPAVCGLPKKQAQEFLLEHEQYDREFYAGFHGELNHEFATGKANTELFVNLRCMKVAFSEKAAKASIYVGGGITKDSVPELEWAETVQKSQTIKKALQ